MNHAGRPLVERARAFALEAHGEQQYGSHPYQVHLDAVAELVQEHGEEAEALAYLHDVVEDTPVEIDAIAEAFGRRIADCVAILTDEPGDSRAERKRKSYARMARVSGDLELALIVKAADRLANMRACVADGNDELLGVYKEELASFREAAYREGLCWSLWSEMEEICASAQHGGYNYRFYDSRDQYPGYMIRRKHRPGELHSPEEWVAGRWTTGAPSVMDAISGMTDDVWSSPSWYADPLTPEQARSYAAEHGIDLFAEASDSAETVGGAGGWHGSSPARRSLVFGALCAGVGLVFGILVSVGAAGDGYRWFFVSAALAAFGSGTALWRVLPERFPRRRPAWGALAGALAGVVSLYLTWYLGYLGANLCFWLTGGCTSSLGEPPADLLTALSGAAALTFFSLLIVGWLTAPIGAVLGWVFGRLSRRK